MILIIFLLQFLMLIKHVIINIWHIKYKIMRKKKQIINEFL